MIGEIFFEFVQIALFILENSISLICRRWTVLVFFFEYDRRGISWTDTLFFRIDSDNFLSFRVRDGF